TLELVDRQRGSGVYERSIAALRELNALGYGADLALNLVYNPQGPTLPPAQDRLEADYKRELAERHGVVFNRLYTLANMPIQRFGSTLVSKGQFAQYMELLLRRRLACLARASASSSSSWCLRWSRFSRPVRSVASLSRTSRRSRPRSTPTTARIPGKRCSPISRCTSP